MEARVPRRLAKIEDSVGRLVDSQDAQIAAINHVRDDVRRESRQQYAVAMMALGFAAGVFGATIGDTGMVVFGMIFMGFAVFSILLKWLERWLDWRGKQHSRGVSDSRLSR